MTTNEKLLHLLKELLWLGVTALITYVILYPITQKIDYIYYTTNAIFIFLAITYFRWSVTLRNLPFFRPAWVRFIAFVFNFGLFFYLIAAERRFLTYIDDFYVENFGFPKVTMFPHVQEQLFHYLYTEIAIFATGSLLMILAFNARLIISWWQFYKYRANAMFED